MPTLNPNPSCRVNVCLVCEEFRPDGHDVLVWSVLSYSLMGISTPTHTNRRDWKPEEMADRVANMGAHGLTVVLLDCKPPSDEERAQLDEEFLAYTGEGNPPSAYSDDWVTEIGPKCAAAVLAAQSLGTDYMVVMPLRRFSTLTGPIFDTLQAIEGASGPEEAVEVAKNTTFGLNTQDGTRITVPLDRLSCSFEPIILNIIRQMQRE